MFSRKIEIFTDGSSLGNPGRGGWAAVLLCDGKIKEISGGYRFTTNGRMELLAVVEALSALQTECSDVVVYMDSEYIVNSINKGWLGNWQRKNWRKSNNKPVENTDLWERLVPLLNKHKVKFQWLKAHSGIAYNERCDVLAKVAAENAVDADVEYERKIANSHSPL